MVAKIDQTNKDTITKISDLRPQIQLNTKNTISEMGTATIKQIQEFCNKEYKLPYTNNEVATSHTSETASNVIIILFAEDALSFL